jgi:hypothetical protein
MKAMSMHPAGEAYTLQDYLQWEGDWELIRGQPVAMVPSPSFEHQQVSAAIFRQLDESLDDCPHCQAVFEIDVEFAQDTVVRPDVLVICYQPEGERLTRAPDLIFEVISPRTTRGMKWSNLAVLGRPDHRCRHRRHPPRSDIRRSQGLISCTPRNSLVICQPSLPRPVGHRLGYPAILKRAPASPAC